MADNFRIVVGWLFVLNMLVGSACALPAPPQPKKVIEFGWDIPDTSIMKSKIVEMQNSPFDGCVFELRLNSQGGAWIPGTLGLFSWNAFGTRAIRESELRRASYELTRIPFGRFKENFIRFNVTPGDVDWIDGFQPVLENARLIARIARDAQVRGILFDTEYYQKNPFDYRIQAKVHGKSWEDFSAVVEERGRQFIEALQQEYPGITVFMTFGFSLPHAKVGVQVEKLPEAQDGLFVPFLNGMLSGAKGDTKLIDGFEYSYPFKSDWQFREARETLTSKLLPLVKDVEAYKRHVSAAFGVALDYRGGSWSAIDLAHNYFPPDKFAASVQYAMNASDEYVWIYSERPRWWNHSKIEERVPPAYVEALRTTMAATNRMNESASASSLQN